MNFPLFSRFLFLTLILLEFHNITHAQPLSRSQFEEQILEISTMILFDADRQATGLKKSNCPAGVKEFLYVYELELSPTKMQNKNLAINCQDWQKVTQYIYELNVIYKSTQLKKVSLVLAETLDNALFDHVTKALLVPKTFSIEAQTKFSSDVLTIMGHEFGHFLLVQFIPGFNPANVSVEESFYLVAASEVLADLFVVLKSQDPKIIYKALQFTKSFQKKPAFKASAIARDFSERSNELEKVESRLKNQSKLSINTFLNMPHNFFSPIRYHLWKYYFSRTLSSDQKRNLAIQTGKVFLKVIKRNMRNISENSMTNFSSFNRAVVKELDLSLTKL